MKDLEICNVFSSFIDGKNKLLECGPSAITMNNPNDHIIEAVFQAMLKHISPTSPEATFYQSMKQANQPIDNRMLANFIIQDFPWPVGVELRRLFSGDLKERDKGRIDQVLKVGERLAQFFTFCLLVQFWDERKSKNFPLTKDFQVQISQFTRPSFGTFAGLLRAMHDIFEKEGIQPFLDYQDANSKFKDFLESLNLMVKKRNEERHHATEMDCEEGEEILKDLLVRLAVLTKYKLVTIREIKVVGPKLKRVVFQHSIRMLNSQHEDFGSIDQSYEDFAESHAVLLMKDFTSPKEYLNLSPFVIDTSTLTANQKIAGIKNGIYLYHHIRDGKIFYSLTNAPEQSAMNDLPFFNYLEEQFADFSKTLMEGQMKLLA